jgi:hypothetical protein
MPLSAMKNLLSSSARRLHADGARISDEKKTDSLDEEIKAFRATDADLQEEQKPFGSASVGGVQAKCPFSGSTTSATSDARRCPYHFVPLKMGGNGGTHKSSSKAAALVKEIGGVKGLEKMTSHFYNNAFQDQTLDKFIRDRDEPHANRFALWIHQKLTGSHKWDAERATRSQEPVVVAGGRTAVVHDRSSAHAAAWYSPKRPKNEVGRHFKLDECRVWMRLHFWALRECVGDRSPSFVDYYVRFIGHFVSVYEGSAPAFARESYRWSADPTNIEKYLANGRRMNDVLGVHLRDAQRQIPEEEAYDDVWPYLR